MSKEGVELDLLKVIDGTAIHPHMLCECRFDPVLLDFILFC